MQPQPLTFHVALPQGANQELSNVDALDAWHRIETTAILAEEVGYAGAWLLDRTETLPRREREPVFDGWTSLAALARLTSRIGLGQISPGAPFRNVMHLAKRAACVDVMSAGRLTLAVDPLGYGPEHQSYGRPRLDTVEAESCLQETLRTLRSAWAQPRVTVEGEYVQAYDAYCEPKPFHGTMPILVEQPRGTSPSAGVASLADGVIWRLGPEDFGHQSRLLTERCDQAGRPPAELSRVLFAECRIFDSKQERDRWLATPHVVAFWSEHPDLYMQRNLVGTVEAVTEQLAAYVAVGVQRVILWFNDYPQVDSLTRFATEVAPRFTGAADLPA